MYKSQCCPSLLIQDTALNSKEDSVNWTREEGIQEQVHRCMAVLKSKECQEEQDSISKGRGCFQENHPLPLPITIQCMHTDSVKFFMDSCPVQENVQYLQEEGVNVWVKLFIVWALEVPSTRASLNSFIPIFSVLMEHLLCARWCSLFWVCGGEQKWIWFCLLGIHRFDRNEDEAAYSHKFCHFMISWSDRCLQSFHPKCCSSFKFVFQWPSLLSQPQTPASWLTGGHFTTHTGGCMHLTTPTNPARSGLNFSGLEIRPGQVACLLSTLVHVPGRVGAPHGIWLNIKIKPRAASFPTHLSHLTSHSHFFCPVFLVVEWPKPHLAALDGHGISCFSPNVCWDAQQGTDFLFSFHSLNFFLAGAWPHSGSLSARTLSNAFCQFVRWQFIFFPPLGTTSFCFSVSIFSRPLIRCLIKSPGSL